MKMAIRWVATSLARLGGSGGQTPTQQVTYMGKAANVVPWMPYGLAASVPPDKLGVGLSILGNSDSSVYLPGSPGEDPTLAVGETALYHPATGSKVHMRADGSIDILAGTVTATLTAAGGVTITPGSAPVTIAGDLTVTGATVLGAVVTSNGKDISDTHTHLAGSLLDSVPAAVTGTTGIPV